MYSVLKKLDRDFRIKKRDENGGQNVFDPDFRGANLIFVPEIYII